MIKITKPGLLTSIQDLGRYGYQKYGVIVSGVMDPQAHRIANLLVGNEENTPTMEITLVGPTIAFEENALISICGGDLSPSIDGEPVRLWRAIFVKKGSELKFGRCKSGCRAYLAVAGGYSIPSVMESKSTYLRANIGGFNGNALRAGDQLSFEPMGELSNKITEKLKISQSHRRFVEADWSVTHDLIRVYRDETLIRVIKGRQFHLFTSESKEKLFSEPFEVMPQSDRMGYRIKGPGLAMEQAEEMISEAVSFGTIQVPSGGNPIILLADRQTTGGYPKIGQIATVDLPYLAQAKPGDLLRFTEVSHEQAQRLFLKRERKIQEFKKGIHLKFS
jgi:antagonist of KipI